MLDKRSGTVFLEGISLADDFPFLQANCIDVTVWRGDLRKQVEYLEQALKDIDSLALEVSPVIETVPAGPLVWAIPAAMSASGSRFKASRMSELTDSRILRAQFAKRNPENGQVVLNLDRRRNWMAEVCDIPSATREKFFVGAYASQLVKVHQFKAYEADSVATISAARAEGVKQADFYADALMGKWPMPISSLATAFENPTDRPNLYSDKIGRTAFPVIIVGRNELWANAIDQQLRKRGGISVSFMGIAHLPSFFDGSKVYPGMLELLTMRGYQVSPVCGPIEAISTLGFDINSVTALHVIEAESQH